MDKIIMVKNIWPETNDLRYKELKYTRWRNIPLRSQSTTCKLSGQESMKNMEYKISKLEDKNVDYETQLNKRNQNELVLRRDLKKKMEELEVAYSLVKRYKVLNYKLTKVVKDYSLDPVSILCNDTDSGAESEVEFVSPLPDAQPEVNMFADSDSDPEDDIPLNQLAQADPVEKDY
jgi:hypothetical protein